MSGKGTEVGRTFEEIKQIIDGLTLSYKMGVCLDSCHVYDAGYDIVNDLDGVIDEFDRIINHPKLRVLPFFLETPNELSGYAEEIKMLREAYRD